MKKTNLLVSAVAAMAALGSIAGEAPLKADLKKPFTAISDASKAIGTKSEAEKDFFFKAAIAADWAGDSVQRHNFLAYHLSLNEGKSPEVQRALVRLMASGDSPDLYKRYISQFPKDFDALMIGIDLLRKYVNDGKTRDYRTLLETMIATFPDGAGFDTIVDTMNWTVLFSNAPGFDDGKLTLKALGAAKGWKVTIRLNTFFWELNRRNLCQQEIYEVYRDHRDLKWNRECLERIAFNANVPDDTALEALKTTVGQHGFPADQKARQGYFQRFQQRFAKVPAWQKYLDDVNSGKIKPAEKPAYDLYGPTRALNDWEKDHKAKKLGGAEAIKRAAEIVKDRKEWHFEDRNKLFWMFRVCHDIAVADPKNAAAFPFESFAQIYLDQPPRCRADALGLLLDVYDKTGKFDQGIARVKASADRMGTALGCASWRYAAVAMCTRTGDPRNGFILEDVTYNQHKKALKMPDPARNRLNWNLAAAKKFSNAPVPELIWFPDRFGTESYALDVHRWTREAKRKPTPEEEAFSAAGTELINLATDKYYSQGVRRFVLNSYIGTPLGWYLWPSAVNANSPKLPCRIGAVELTGTRRNGSETYGMASILVTNGCPELAYLMISRHPEMSKSPDLQRLRTMAQQKMPGLYPVNEKDPAYPLYVAADALARNNPERAWSLLSANLKTFDQNPLRYQPAFALWALDQYRKVRGENDVLRNKAWTHVEKLLAQEASLPPDVAAGLFLLRARIAEDRMEYEVAHSGYMALRNHATYRKTPSGRQAMFRDIELMITMGSLDAAAQVAEQWISSPDEDVRAQGHYVLAKIAFQRKEFDETRKELEKVFEIDFTHSEGRLLQGEWKLATNYEVDDTQVLLGDLSDRSVIRPGQPLSISVKDRNLSVAGGGASIPVLVKTSLGQDVEKVQLYPGTRDPSLFRGSIDTEMGVAKPGNHTLQLSGDDIVSYEIDPDFMKLRGIKSSQVKRLSVVDDAEMRIGVFSGDDQDTIHLLKPGVPMPVELVDRDRSRHAATNSVAVTIRTSSGDVIQAAPLAEAGRCTGVYRAMIPTRIPPPRAFASDSTAGAGPEDLVSSVRNGVWRSLADGQKPKFVGLDTMSSHMVKSAAIELPAPETVAEIKLWGSSTGDDEVLLGAYPGQDKENRRGIRMVTCESRSRNRTEFLRELSKRILTPIKLDTFGYHRTQTAQGYVRYRVQATAFFPEDRTFKLRLRPSTQNNETFRWLACDLFVDGKRVWNAWQNSETRHKQSPFMVEIGRGIHSLELYGSSFKVSDSFDLCEVKEDGELEPLSGDYFDATVHPEITEHLEDKCKVLKSKTGFTASFDNPMRLRTLRWEFVDFTGTSVEAKKLHLDTADGKRVIPSEHDFTESLGNDILEVAPGDIITVTYDDETTSSGKARAIERKLNTRFSDGKIGFLCEHDYQDGYGRLYSRYTEAYRVEPGDVVTVRVTDSDLNLSRGRDTMKLVVSTSGGDKLVVTAEEPISVIHDGREYIKDTDQGVFIARLRTREKPYAEGEKRPADMIVLKRGESIEAAYKDEDNTHPGVPCVRKAHLAAIQADAPTMMQLSHTWSRRVPDKSPEGRVRLKSVQRRGFPLATNTWCDVSGKRVVADGATAIVTPQVSLPVDVVAPMFAKHSGSVVVVEATTRSELKAAEEGDRPAEWTKAELRITPGHSSMPNGFKGSIELYSAAVEERSASASEDFGEEREKPVDLKAGDELVVRLCGQGGVTLAEATAKIGTTAWMGLCDPTYNAGLYKIHLGESFHIMIVDPDCDTTDEQDEVKVEVASKSGAKCELMLRETLGRSGIFTGQVSTDVKMPGVTNFVATASSFPAEYGDEFTFTYSDEVVGFGATNSVVKLTGTILPGSDGAVRSYSKRFRDADQAVLVQFRMAECLFEMAKDFRKLKDGAKSASAIADGRAILEAALRDYPNTSHAAEGEYLLANLYEQLGEEERQARLEREKNGEDVKNEPDKADPLFREAVARFAAILSAWPEGEYAARSQYHKALCLERLGDFARSSEEYVKMTYLFPESPLVGDAAVRLASHYYKREERFDIAGKIYSSFRTRFPAHPQAPSALFMGGQCLIKQGELMQIKAKEEMKKKGQVMRGLAPQARDAYKDAIEAFVSLLENYKDIPNKDLLAQGLYWAGDVSFRIEDYANAYIYLKRTTFEYPESKWARFARGMLLQNSQAFDVINE